MTKVDASVNQNKLKTAIKSYVFLRACWGIWRNIKSGNQSYTWEYQISSYAQEV